VSLAIVLRWRPYGESDKIVTFLSQDFGKLTGIAKGAQRSRRRFPNSLEALARVRMHFRLRPNASLAFLESADLLHPPAELTEPTRFAYASYLAELIDQLTLEEQPVQELYALLEQGLTELAQWPASSGLLRAFELQLLARAGFEPMLDHCHVCRRILPEDQDAYLDTAHGTVTCNGCRQAHAPLSPYLGALLTRLSDLLTRPLPDCRALTLGAHAMEAAKLTGQLLALHIHRPLRSLKLIEQLTPSVGCATPIGASNSTNSARS
jgi:DNA repair protein RecO (recombination protein O)